jgi:hypothetical protein
MRGTDDLSPEQKPSGMKRTRRGQPYRKRRLDRQQGPSLSAMLKGAPAFLPNPQDAKRNFQKRFGR